MANLSEAIGLSFKTKSVTIYPDRMSADDTDTHTDAGNYGSGAGHIHCVDFLNTGSGGVWFATEWLSGWRMDQDIHLELTFGMEGGVAADVIKMNASYWFLDNGDTEPGAADQATDFNYTAQAGDASNAYVVHSYVGDGGTGWSADPKALQANFGTSPNIMIVKLTRDGANVADTFAGTLHLIKVRLFQNY